MGDLWSNWIAAWVQATQADDGAALAWLAHAPAADYPHGCPPTYPAPARFARWAEAARGALRALPPDHPYAAGGIRALPGAQRRAGICYGPCRRWVFEEELSLREGEGPQRTDEKTGERIYMYPVCRRCAESADPEVQKAVEILAGLRTGARPRAAPPSPEHVAGAAAKRQRRADKRARRAAKLAAATDE